MNEEKIELVQTDWRVLRDNCFADMVAKKKEHGRLRAKTRNQAVYMKAIETSTVTICRGPAGTGKTFIPCAMAAETLRDQRIERIVLTRPLVTCSGRKGQGVGFLPGDLMAKVGPYMRPMLDVLVKFFRPDELEKRIALGNIEIVPLDYMRGLSIDNAFVVADEMQNADKEQTLMLLTRIGENTRLVMSGDLTQTDLRLGNDNGLLHAIRALWGIEDISMCQLTEEDIVRSRIVKAILKHWQAPTSPA